MFRAHRPIFRRVHTAVHTTIGSVSVLLWPCALYCRISTCFRPTDPSSGEFTQLFTQPLVQCLYCSGHVLCIAGSLHVSGPQAHPHESSHSCSHNHWFSVCIALAVCSVLLDLYMFQAHRPILRRFHTAVHTTIGSVSVLLWPCALYCRISTCFRPTGLSSGDFTQLFTHPLVQCLYCSGRVLCIAGSLHVLGPQAYPQEISHSCSHNHWFSVCIALAVCSVLPDLYMFWAHRPILRRVHTAVHTTIGSASVLLWPCALYCRISTGIGPTGPSSGEFTQLFTQPLVQCLYCSGHVLCIQSTRPELYRH